MTTRNPKPSGAPGEVIIGPRGLPGILNVPIDVRGLVLFAHGSGSSRLSARNQFVAGVLQDSGLATLLFDLLTDEESEDRVKVFDIELLAERLQEAADWSRQQPSLNTFRLGYFGASTGAAAALVAAARRPQGVAAVVSRGGRPDLAEAYLSKVEAPTLLIVGGRDELVLELNQQAFTHLACQKDLVVIPGATHLFPEQGALEDVARFARQWFLRHLGGSRGTAGSDSSSR